MAIQLIAVHYNVKKEVVGFRLLDTESGETIDKDYNTVLRVVQSKRAEIIGMEFSSKTKSLKGSNGAFERYPMIVNGRVVNKSLVIVNSVDDVGYAISNYIGKILEASSKDVIKIALNEKMTIANGKLVTKGDKQYISAINGSYTNVPLSKSNKLKFSMDRLNKESQNIQAELAKKKLSRVGTGYYPKVVTGIPAKESKLKEVDPATQLTVEQKMTYALLAVKAIKPFYYSILNILKRNEANPEDGIDTMGVTLHELYFSSDFVKELTLAELIFVCLHETCHIAMKHRVREGNRNHDLWNVACDYYINKLLATEFNLCEKTNFVYVHQDQSGRDTQYRVAMPSNCLYNELVDLEKDTPEKLYAELEQINENQDSNQNNDGEEGRQGQGQSQQGQSQQGQRQKGQGNGKSGEQSLEDFANGNMPDDEESDTASEKTLEKIGNKGATGSSKDGTGDPSESTNNSNEKRKGKLVGKEFRGKKIPEYEPDIVTTENERAVSQEQLEQAANSLLRRAVVIHKQSNTFGGHTADYIERLVEEELAPKIDWRRILKSYLIEASKKINTFSAPDRRFRSRGMILPGPKALENDALKNIKICVDTSGSISNKDLGVVLNQINQLLKVYKADAELLYWDTLIRAIYPFKKMDDLIDKKPMGGGGTDANCVFEYFETEKDYKIGKKPKPSLIIIFTDGYIPDVKKQYSKYKDVLWVVQGNKYFTAPFGKVVPFKND